MFRRLAALTLILLIAGALDVSGADQVATTKTTPLGVGDGVIALAESGPESAVALASLAPTAKRPAQLTGLYATFTMLQVMDVISTRKARASGRHEMNPLMRGNIGTTIALKTASATATVYLTEKLWKRNRVAAVVVMAAINSAGLIVVAQNNHTASR
jgi:hypothetical protein